MTATADPPRGGPGRIGQGGGAPVRDGTARGDSARRVAAAQEGAPGAILPIFLISLVVSLTFFLGPLRLSPYRVILLVMFVPLFFQWLSGRFGGKPILPDVLLAIYGVWIVIAMLMNHGMERFSFGVITAVEGFGSYLLGRYLVRTPADFERFTRIFLAILLVILPFVALEAITGQRIIATIIRGAGAHFGIAHAELRWGMTRAQGPFEHPILWGVFASAGFALAFYALSARGSRAASLFWTGVAGLGTFYSLSMGAYVSGMIQVGLMGYEMTTRGWAKRWTAFIAAVTSVYMFFHFFSHRGLIGIFIAYAAFNPFAASVRIQTWNFGTEVVMRNPVFGIGFKDWSRPGWLTGSVDNFWLLNAMRYGLPAALCMMAAIIIIINRTARTQNDDPAFGRYRYGYVISLLGVCFALASVHAWNALYSFLFFFIGAGVWMIGHEQREVEAAAPDRRRPVAAVRRPGVSAPRPGPDEPRPGSGPRRPVSAGAEARAARASGASGTTPPQRRGPVRPVRPSRG